MSTYDVRVQGIRSYAGARGTSYTVRWVVAGKGFRKTLRTKALAEGFRSKLLSAAREGTAYDEALGLPEPMARELKSSTWYEHATAFADMKWSELEPKSRRVLADALATVTPALVSGSRGAPDPRVLRKALYTWAFNRNRRTKPLEGEPLRAVEWLRENSVSLTALNDATVLRSALDSLAVRLDGEPAAATTVSRKRNVLHAALEYAVELNYLPANPLDRIRWKTPRLADAVDSRVVVNPTQARQLLAAVAEVSATGQRLAAFFAVMYFAALRPSEVIGLRESDCELPTSGWGTLRFESSRPYAGAQWTDTGESRPRKALKHRAKREFRTVPACPELVEMLRAHIKRFGTAEDGRIFGHADGRVISETTYARIWREARKKGLTREQAASPLAGRPYDLRHAAVSTWLNAGVPAPQVAAWAGHSVDVLLRVYAKCIDGQEKQALIRIIDALNARADSS